MGSARRGCGVTVCFLRNRTGGIKERGVRSHLAVARMPSLWPATLMSWWTTKTKANE
jgi:hypothetical protein